MYDAFAMQKINRFGNLRDDVDRLVLADFALIKLTIPLFLT
jgi:hypothetical protein